MKTVTICRLNDAFFESAELSARIAVIVVSTESGRAVPLKKKSVGIFIVHAHFCGTL